MSYTHAQVLWEACSQTNSIIDMYGDIERAPAVAITARKQPHQEVVKDRNGHDILTKCIYYVDPYVEPNALNIKEMDKLDGDTILNIYEMRDLYNNVRMVRFITI